MQDLIDKKEIFWLFVKRACTAPTATNLMRSWTRLATIFPNTPFSKDFHLNWTANAMIGRQLPVLCNR